MSIEKEIFHQWLVRKGRHSGVEELFGLMKGHDGLTAVDETVTRDGHTFQQKFWERTGAETAAAKQPSAQDIAETQPTSPPGHAQAQAPSPSHQAEPTGGKPQAGGAKPGQKMWQRGMVPYPPEPGLDQLREELGSQLPGGLDFDQHVEIANQFIGKHKEGYQRLKDNLESMAPEGAQVTGRVKTVASTMGKLVRKPDSYPRADMLGDATGTRITCNSIDDVLETVNKIKAKYQLAGEDDYITTPNGTYRSYHLAIIDEDGLTKEVQVRTNNQNDYADWCHDIYKPITPEQKAAVKANKPVLDEYGMQMSNWYYANDMGQDPGEKPPCPEIVGEVFGCL